MILILPVICVVKMITIFLVRTKMYNPQSTYKERKVNGISVYTKIR